MKMRHFVMVAGLIVAAGLAFFGDKSSTSNIAEPVTREATSGKSVTENSQKVIAAQSAATKSARDSQIMALQDRETLIGSSQQKKSGKGLFGSQNWAPPPPPPAKPPPPPPPMAPPVPFSYIGKKFDGRNWEVYFMRGEKTYIVHENEILDNTYHVDSIKPPTLTLTYLPLQQVQNINIGGTD